MLKGGFVLHPEKLAGTTVYNLFLLIFHVMFSFVSSEKKENTKPYKTKTRRIMNCIGYVGRFTGENTKPMDDLSPAEISCRRYHQQLRGGDGR